jgi:hypothetical protein
MESVEEKKCNHTKEGKECPEHGMKGCPVDEQEEKTEITEIHGQAHKPHEVPSGNLKKLVKKAVKRIDTDVDGDTDHNDKAKGELGEFIPGVGNKRLYSTTKTKTAKESFSDWREELRELVDVTSSKPKTDEKSREKISEKKVKNKIVINPPQGMTEAIEEIGGQILEMVEIEESENADAAKSESMRKKQLASREQMMKKQHLLDKQRMQAQKQLRMPSGHMEGLSIDQQMKISQDYNRMSPEEKKASNKKALGTIKRVKREKDTRTDAQKMTDATGPRPGSRYRGD